MRRAFPEPGARMRRARRLSAVVATGLCLSLAACLPVPEGRDGPATLAPAEVTTETLPDAEPQDVQALPAQEAGAQAEPAATPAEGADAEQAEAVEPPPPPPDPETAACQERGGRMIPGPAGIGRLCQVPAPDAGRSCSSARDCAGLCLARGNICAPVIPLLGCHDILLNDGSSARQCIE